MRGLIAFCLLILLGPAPVWAQGSPGLPRLSGPQKNTLLLIAREAVDATLEGRPSRAPTVEPRLNQVQPLVLSIFIDGRLRGRAWRLRGGQPLYLEVKDLAYEAIANPKLSPGRLPLEDLARAKVSVAVLSGFARVQSEAEIPSGAAVIIYYNFTEGLALPGDASGGPADLLRLACERAGLRPNIWLLPRTLIFTAQVEESRE